jgi:hypothetical protein
MTNKRNIGYDETKKMLNTLRHLNETLSKKKIIKEQSDEDDHSWEDESWQWTKDEEMGDKTPEMSQNLKNDLIVINDVEVKLISVDNVDMKLTDEQKTSISTTIDNFKQQVTNLVEFDPGMTVSMDQVRLDGTITDLDYRFTVVAGKDSGLYIVSDMTEITPEFIDSLTKFNKFYQTFVDAMNNIIEQRKNN